MRKLLILPVVGALVFGLALTVLATHINDGGIDEPWDAAMNQETYWETRFGADCTKYERHNGFIPEQYDAAVIKDGNMVRVYTNVGGAFTAIGAVNPANGQHFGSPHSWVMKCTFAPLPSPPPSVTAECLTLTINALEDVEYEVQIGDGLVDASGTSEFFGSADQLWAVYYQGQTIASGVFESCSITTTTSTPAPTTSTTSLSTTTTDPGAEPTTTIGTTTTAPPLVPSSTVPSGSTSTVKTLPYTGIEDWLPFAALALIGAGWVLARGFRAED